MSDLVSIADEYHRYRQESDQLRLLWKGDLEYLEHWEELSPEATERRRADLREFADRIEDATTEDTPADQLALAETVAFTARAGANELRWTAQLMAPNPAIGIHSLLLTFLPRYTLVDADHGERYHEKLRRLPEMLDQVGAAARTGPASGIMPLTSHLTATIAAIDAQLAHPGHSDPLTGQTPPRDLTQAEASTWSAETARLIAEEVRPALARYRNALADVADAGRSDDEPGLCHLEGGSQHYEDLVWSHTTLETSADAVHRVGLEQIDRLEDEYLRVAGPAIGVDDLEGIYGRLRDDPALRYRSGDQIVADATRAVAKAEAAAPSWFGRLPRSRCVASEAHQGALAFYSKPDPAAGKPGTFYFNTSVPEAWGTFQLEAVTYHESIPGHHLQLALLVEDDSIHPVHADLPITAHSEGWGLYTERLADEMGLYGSELDRIGMLAADSMRACRLVVDTGMHALGWSRRRAVDYILDHSPLTRRLAEGEVDRYIGMPGQALSYMTGRLEIDRLRAESERRAGDAFDIKDFHHRILRHGLVPLPILRDLVLS